MRLTKTDKILNDRIEAFKRYPWDTLFTAEFMVRILEGVKKEMANVRRASYCKGARKPR